MRTARSVHAAGAMAVAVLVLLQAVLAGRALFGTWSITVHGVVGNVTFAVSLLVVAAALAAKVSRHALGVAIVLLVLVTVQVGLGYAGRESREAAAWHIPNGVATFGLAVYQVALLRGRDATRARAA